MMHSRRTQSKRLARVVCFLFLIVSFSGCGSQNSGSISGKISYGEMPVPAGMVVFASDKTTCSGQITDGQYELVFEGGRSIPLAQYSITVFPPDAKFEYNPETGEEEHVPSGIDPRFFPKKYKSKATSGLTFTPVVGENKFDIDLKGK